MFSSNRSHERNSCKKTINMLKISCVHFLIVLLFGIVQSYRSVGDVCLLESTESEGICTLLKDCQQADEDLRRYSRFPRTCGFQGMELIVCCQRNKERLPGEMSKQKCREYAKYVYQLKRPPVALINSPKILSNECGHKVVPLVVGGEVAGRREFPHMAVIGYEPMDNNNNNNSIKWNCGGIIVSEQFILTAGHCLISMEFGPAKYVRVGITNLKNPNQRQEFTISERIRHPDYKPPAQYNDIGLLKLEKSIKLNPFARPACLYQLPKIKATKAIATGWGATSQGGSTSDDLMKVTLDLFNQEVCYHKYKNMISSRRLKSGIREDIQLCAGSFDEEKDTCQGDSGGPLQIYHTGDDIECMYDIIGITSFGMACNGNPGVYTRISTFIKWIEDTVWPQV